MTLRAAFFLSSLFATFAMSCGDKSQDPKTDTAQDTSVNEVSSDTGAPDVAPDVTESDSASNDSASEDVADTSSNPNDTGSDTSTGDTASDTSDTSAPAACGPDDECTYCVFDTVPKTVADCVCPFCPTHPMPKSLCASNTAAWEAVCGGANWLDSANCPQPRCVNNPPLECNAGVCEPGCDPTVGCPALLCPESEQETLPGECCPRCKEKTGCGQDGDCVTCAYPNFINNPTECECILCPSTPMTAAECAANTASWQTHCDPWPLNYPCPVAMCLPQAAPICETSSGACLENPNSCFSPEDCGSCLFPVAPQVPSDCQCPTCAVPLNIETCQANQAAVDTVCSDFDFDACLPVPCPRPPEITCTESFTCGYDFQVR
jgi:hypothetical protein